MPALRLDGLTNLLPRCDLEQNLDSDPGIPFSLHFLRIGRIGSVFASDRYRLAALQRMSKWAIIGQALKCWSYALQCYLSSFDLGDWTEELVALTKSARRAEI